MVDSNTIYCPFCGKDITKKYKRHIKQEETISRDYSFETHWHGRYINETKTKRMFIVSCCEECYNESEKFEHWSDKYVCIVYPIDIIVAIVVSLFQCYFENNWSFSLIVFRPIVYSLLLILITGIPVIIGNLIYKKTTSYKHAKKCNALGY